MKFKFKCEHEAEQGGSVTVTFEEVSLPKILERVADFLRGCGFAYIDSIDYTKTGEEK